MKSSFSKFLFLSVSLLIGCYAKAQIITTYAGTGIAGYTGDSGPATNAQLYSPYGLALDDSGNLYIAERVNCIIRKVTPAGITSTYAGTGVAGYSGDGGQATDAKINFPYGLVTDHSGNLYFTDNGNNAIRKISSTGIITTLHPVMPITKCGPIPILVTIQNPTGIAIDNAHNLYFANTDWRMVMKVPPSNIAIIFVNYCGALSYTGDGGLATAAALNNPLGLAVDQSGNLYVADQGNNVVRKVNTANIISTCAGNGTAPAFYGDGGPATACTFYGPCGVTTDLSGNLYIQDLFNRRIRKVDPMGIITTVAGNGVAAYAGDGGPATAASFHYCTGFAVDNHTGIFYISDLNYSVIRKVEPGPLKNDEVRVVNNNIILYPNPNKGSFAVIGAIDSKNNEHATVEVLSMTGQVVYRNSIQPQNGTIDTQIQLDNSLANGTYILSINSTRETIIARFVIAK